MEGFLLCVSYYITMARHISCILVIFSYNKIIMFCYKGVSMDIKDIKYISTIVEDGIVL